MTFNDIFKNSFLEGFTNGIDIKTIIVSFLGTALLSVFIFFVYRVVSKKAFYSKNFNISLVAMAIITAAIILTIQSNIVLSLGMVGALSIVRFRTAIKDPLDLVFLYWSISIGIICGAGLTAIAFILSAIMAIVIIVVQKYPVKKSSMLLVVNANDPDCDQSIMDVVKTFDKSCKTKSKNVTTNSLNMIIELNVDTESVLVKKVMNVNGVISASLITHDGEITA